MKEQPDDGLDVFGALMLCGTFVVCVLDWILKKVLLLFLLFVVVNMRELLWQYQKASNQYHFEKCETKGAVFIHE